MWQVQKSTFIWQIPKVIKAWIISFNCSYFYLVFWACECALCENISMYKHLYEHLKKTRLEYLFYSESSVVLFNFCTKSFKLFVCENLWVFKYNCFLKSQVHLSRCRCIPTRNKINALYLQSSLSILPTRYHTFD